MRKFRKIPALTVARLIVAAAVSFNGKHYIFSSIAYCPPHQWRRSTDYACEKHRRGQDSIDKNTRVVLPASAPETLRRAANDLCQIGGLLYQ